MNKRKVIIDTDPGIDDALAIIAALKHPDLEVLGLTSVAGNKGIQFTTDNAARVLTYFDSGVKVYRGATNDYLSLKAGAGERADEAGFVHGATGLGSVDLPINSDVYANQNAIDFILETIQANPGEVDIIALGPLTNLALCVEKDLETMKQVRSIHSMGGGVHRGNRSPVAEFNYWFDPTAVDLMFTELGPHVPIWMIGLDVTHQGIIDMNDLTFMKMAGGELGAMLYEMMQFYVNTYWHQNGYMGAVIHDLMAVIGYIYPDMYSEIYHANLRCVSDSELAKGQCIVDLHDQFKWEKNAYVPMKADIAFYKEQTMAILFGEEAAEDYKKRVKSLG